VWWQRYENQRNRDFVTTMIWIMTLDAKPNRILAHLGEDDGEEEADTT
jgi:hypothetical protein